MSRQFSLLFHQPAPREENVEVVSDHLRIALIYLLFFKRVNQTLKRILVIFVDQKYSCRFKDTLELFLPSSIQLAFCSHLHPPVRVKRILEFLITVSRQGGWNEGDGQDKVVSSSKLSVEITALKCNEKRSQFRETSNYRNVILSTV